MTNYETIILLSWAAFLFVWVALAFNIKRDTRGSYSGWWKKYWLMRAVAAIAIFAFLRITTNTTHYTSSKSLFDYGIFNPSLLLGWIAAVLTLLGLGIAIWARLHIGRNWSPRPAIKEHHELVTTGPYAYVRHPIYTGVILMVFGTALTGSIFGIVMFIAGAALFISRISIEEKIMLDLFPQKYPEYQTRTKKLIPFVW
jgi:protein-S-isoprenylcysteine O-methyltransferase Ste14